MRPAADAAADSREFAAQESRTTPFAIAGHLMRKLHNPRPALALDGSAAPGQPWERHACRGVDKGLEDTMSNDYPGMMGDGTEEQNLGQTGNPSARITEDEVDAAFTTAPSEKRSFLNKEAVRGAASKAKARVADLADQAEDAADEAKDVAAEKISALTDRVNAMRDQVQHSAESARVWAMKQADAAKQTASEKPVLVVSASAGVALAVGLFAGFLIGRATVDDF
jgi:ElaB/YqjD/DUF883 family membrane-anchored ribosome-binding protein